MSNHLNNSLVRSEREVGAKARQLTFEWHEITCTERKPTPKISVKGPKSLTAAWFVGETGI